MPFKSEKQRKWMHANNPKMAKKWEKEKENESQIRSLIKSMVQEVLDETFSIGSSADKKGTKKTAEVLGYQMIGDVEDPSFNMTKTKDRGDGDFPSGNLKEGKVTEAFKVDIDKLLKNPKIQALLKKFKVKGDEAVLKLLNHFAHKPHELKKYANIAFNEAKQRDYKAEYKKYGSSTKSKKYRAELNAYNRKKGTYGNGDGKDASHKGGKITGFEAQSKNRGRREKSRLKKS